MNSQELELWRSFKSGKIEALFVIYELLYEDLWRGGKEITPDNELIKDAIHQFFIYLWDKRTSLSQPQNLRNYLLVSLKRSLIAELKKNGRLNERIFLYDEELTLSPEDGLIVAETSFALALKMKLAIDKLSARKQELVRLKYYEGLSYEEISAITALSIRTVYNKLYEAIKFLKEEFSN